MTPADTAKNEAAKQAVMLVFTLISFAAMWPLYRKIAAQQSDALRNALPHDATMREVADREARMQSARKAAKRWDRASTLAFRYGPARAFSWAFRRGEAARRAYEAERP